MKLCKPCMQCLRAYIFPLFAKLSAFILSTYYTFHKSKKKMHVFKHFQLCMQTLITGGKWMKSVQPIACKKTATFA